MKAAYEIVFPSGELTDEETSKAQFYLAIRSIIYKQTKGDPVFKAMHATACCCRGCLNKWYRVPLHRELTESEQQRIVNLLMAWINKNNKNETTLG